MCCQFDLLSLVTLLVEMINKVIKIINKKAIVIEICIMSILLKLSCLQAYAVETEVVGGFKMQKGFGTAFVSLYNEYKIHILGFTGLAFLMGILGFIINLSRLAQYSTNPQMRNKIIHELIVLGFTTAILGSITLFIGLFFGIIVGK